MCHTGKPLVIPIIENKFPAMSRYQICSPHSDSVGYLCLV